MKILLIFVSILITEISCINYKNAKVINFVIENENQLEIARKLELTFGYKFWDSPVQVNQNIELVVLPQVFLDFQELAEDNEISFEILTNNIQDWFDKEATPKRNKATFGFDEYHTYEEIVDFLHETHAAHPNLTSVFSIGKSFENREIYAIKITKNEENPIIVIDALIHAREWIAGAVSVWLINELLQSSDPSVREVVDKLTWFINPVLNPDGYVYTHENDRLWRKTRSTHASLLCYGADPNRNFGYSFMMGGASSVPCTDTFAGISAFSEPEVKALVDFYDTVYEKVKIYLAMHSAAEMILYPMGHVGTFEEVPNVDDLDLIANATITALNAKHNSSYVYGSSFHTLSMSSGTSKDHMYGHYKTPISYTYEFRKARDGNIRFILPTDEIIPNSEEAFAGLLAMIQKSSELGYF